MNRTLRVCGLACLATLAFGIDDAAAQYPPQPAPQPYPQQPYPQQPYPQQPVQPYQPYPPQPGQPYPPYPQQPVQPYQPYPPQPGQPGVQPYPPYPQQPGQPGAYYPPQPIQPLPPPISTKRSAPEMLSLYIAAGVYGIGTGIWIDALAKIKDPGGDVILPIVFGAGAPVGVYFWDRGIGQFPRGVAASTAAGIALGGVEGIAISGTQWQYERGDNKDWNFRTQTTLTWLLASGGGIGGFAFGEWLKPDPRSMLFIGSGAAWGALSGGMFGIAVQGRHDDWKDGSSVAGLIGYNLGIAGAGAISVFHTPSLQSQKWMWAGYLIGAAAGCIVFPFYLFDSGSSAKHGLIGPALGGLAGTALAGAYTWNLQDSPATAAQWTPPVDLALAPIPALTPSASSSTWQSSRSLSNLIGPDPRWSSAPPGAMLNATGSF